MVINREFEGNSFLKSNMGAFVVVYDYLDLRATRYGVFESNHVFASVFTLFMLDFNDFLTSDCF